MCRYASQAIQKCTLNAWYEKHDLHKFKYYNTYTKLVFFLKPYLKCVLIKLKSSLIANKYLVTLTLDLLSLLLCSSFLTIKCYKKHSIFCMKQDLSHQSINFDQVTFIFDLLFKIQTIATPPLQNTPDRCI